MKKLLYLSVILFLLTGCNLKKNLVIYDGGLPIIPYGQKVPENYTMIGACTYGESGMTPTEECSYEAITRTAIEDARRIGATLVYIAHLKEPRSGLFGSTCYTITVHFYKKKE